MLFSHALVDYIHTTFRKAEYLQPVGSSDTCTFLYLYRHNVFDVYV